MSNYYKSSIIQKNKDHKRARRYLAAFRKLVDKL